MAQHSASAVSHLPCTSGLNDLEPKYRWARRLPVEACRLDLTALEARCPQGVFVRCCLAAGGRRRIGKFARIVPLCQQESRPMRRGGVHEEMVGPFPVR
jgi:hypothetical protein